MSSTLTYGDALAVLASTYPRAAEDSFAARAVNIATSKVWDFADWRETMTPLPPFWLYPDEQDHGAPAVTVPSDFLGLREVYGVQIADTDHYRWPIKVQSNLELTHNQDLPKQIAYNPAARAFRVWPRVPLSAAATQYMIDGTYKKRPTKVLATKLHSTTIPWDDLYFHHYVAALQWALMFLSGHPGAGQLTFVKSVPQYTGQLAVVMTLLSEMADSEGLNLGDPAIAPSEPLVAPYRYYDSPF